MDRAWLKGGVSFVSPFSLATKMVASTSHLSGIPSSMPGMPARSAPRAAVEFSTVICTRSQEDAWKRSEVAPADYLGKDIVMAVGWRNRWSLFCASGVTAAKTSNPLLFLEFCRALSMAADAGGRFRGACDGVGRWSKLPRALKQYKTDSGLILSCCRCVCRVGLETAKELCR